MPKSEHSYFWSALQNELLEQAYKTGGKQRLNIAATLLPEKARTAIAAQASRLKLTTSRPRKRK